MRGQKQPQIDEVQTLHRLLDMGIVENFSVAIDGGAHVGTWAAVMADYFSEVIAFEPTAEAFEMLRENLGHLHNVTCRRQAIMDVGGYVDVRQPHPKRTTLTARFCVKSDKGDTQCVSVDELGLEDCGLIKFDLEGAECLALKGARRTIKRFRPVLVIEIGGLSKRFGFAPDAAHGMAMSMGYREVFRSTVDRVYVSADR